MNKNDFARVTWHIGRHGKVLLRGFVKMMHGTLTAGLIGMAVYCFAMIPSESGYLAVCDFVGAVANLAMSMVGMYALGASRRRAR